MTDFRLLTDEELTDIWWVRMAAAAEFQTARCGCGLREREPMEHCDVCKGVCAARDEVESLLRARGLWTDAPLRLATPTTV